MKSLPHILTPLLSLLGGYSCEHGNRPKHIVPVSKGHTETEKSLDGLAWARAVSYSTRTMVSILMKIGNSPSLPPLSSPSFFLTSCLILSYVPDPVAVGPVKGYRVSLWISIWGHWWYWLQIALGMTILTSVRTIRSIKLTWALGNLIRLHFLKKSFYVR